MNISSIVISTKPENIDKVIEELKGLENEGVDYHFHDDLGRIIVTIEAPSVSEEVAMLKKIETIKYVISADMSYAYSEDELEREKSKIGNNDEKILNSLDDENEEIVYYGSVHNHIDKKE
ncbi:MAG: chaperone NapD [Campylobacteraceae bacterium]|nr:chaperone NapD [Campylobacteraceae bacterium]